MSKEQLQKAVVISSEAMEPALDRLTQPCSRMAPIGVARRDLGTSSMEPAGVPERRRPDAPRPGPPLSIFTLGGFDIYAGHEPLRFGRKVPRKPLDLLATLGELSAGQAGAKSCSPEPWMIRTHRLH